MENKSEETYKAAGFGCMGCILIIILMIIYNFIIK